MNRVCKAECLLLGLKCRVGAAKPSQDTRNPDLALQGLFGTAGCHETMTTTPETSQEINDGPSPVARNYSAIAREVAPRGLHHMSSAHQAGG